MILQERFLTDVQRKWLDARFPIHCDTMAYEIPENERLYPELHEIIVQYNRKLDAATASEFRLAREACSQKPKQYAFKGSPNMMLPKLDDPKSAWSYDMDAFTKWAEKYCTDDMKKLYTPWSYPFKSNPEQTMGWNTDDRKNRERIQTLHPLLRKKAMAHLRALDEKSIKCRITHGERSFAEQDAIYALGRTKPGKIVTNAKGGDSWHNYCLAYDVVLLTYNLKGELIANWDTELPAWDTIIETGKAAGMTHGIKVSGWVDVPHFQDTIGIKNIAEAKALWKRGIIHSWVGVA